MKIRVATAYTEVSNPLLSPLEEAVFNIKSRPFPNSINLCETNLPGFFKDRIMIVPNRVVQKIKTALAVVLGGAVKPFIAVKIFYKNQ